MSDFYKPTKSQPKITDGGPSSYYDFPKNWNTLNDFIEYKSKHQWGEHSFHLGNIVKAVTRWGDKSGTTIEYDAKKIIYSACRVLMGVVGKDKLVEYLKGLIKDPQFMVDKESPQSSLDTPTIGTSGDVVEPPDFIISDFTEGVARVYLDPESGRAFFIFSDGSAGFFNWKPEKEDILRELSFEDKEAIWDMITKNPAEQ